MALNRLKLSCTVTPSCSFLLPPPLFSIILLCWSFSCLLVRRLDETRHRTTCVVFINAKRRNNVIANFRRKSVFKNFSRESWKRRREAGKSWRSRKIFAEPQESRPAFEPTNATATESSPSTMPRVDRSRSHCFALTFSQCCISSKPFFLLHAYIRLTGLLVCVCFRVPAAA